MKNLFRFGKEFRKQIREENARVRRRWEKEALPYFFSGIHGTFQGQGGISIAYRKFDPAPHTEERVRPALVILPGRGEPMLKYAEVVFDLKALGYPVYLMTHRGQGESGWVDQVRAQYVHDFEDYVEDFDDFLSAVVAPHQPSSIFVLAHSMGAAVATLHAHESPGRVQRLALTAPMYSINTFPYPPNLALPLAQFLTSVGLGKWSGARDRKRVTTSLARGKITWSLTQEVTQNHSRKITYQWAAEALKAVGRIQALPAESPVFDLPFLVLQAGRDLQVPPEGQDAFCQRLKQVRKLLYPEAYHELLMESDSIRTPLFQELIAFFQDQQQGPN
jgi:lysophospholipase